MMIQTDYKKKEATTTVTFEELGQQGIVMEIEDEE